MLFQAFGNIVQVRDNHTIFQSYKKNPFQFDAYAIMKKVLDASQNTGAIIDIGANCGITCGLFKAISTRKLVAIEGSEMFLNDLLVNGRALDFEVIPKFVGFQSQAEYGFVQRYSSGHFARVDATNLGEKTVDRSSTSNTISVQEIINKVGDIGLIKSDTDGFDGIIQCEFLDAMPKASIYFEVDRNFETTFASAGYYLKLFEKLKDHCIMCFAKTGRLTHFIQYAAPASKKLKILGNVGKGDILACGPGFVEFDSSLLETITSPLDGSTNAAIIV